MKTAGIIAEFNPFHKGHKYIIDMARREFGADCVIVIMSGNFVQRGEPALFDMGVRANAALRNGADFVFELPPHIALSSAEGFAAGAVKILSDLGVDILVFGSESGDIEVLNDIASVLKDEGPQYKEVLQNALKNGESFPSARETAIKTIFAGKSVMKNTDLHEILHNPNNILGIEYLKALKRLDSSTLPCTVKRINAPYHDKNTLVNGSSAVSSYSAESIRTSVFNSEKPVNPVHRDSLSTLLNLKLISPELSDSLKKAAVPEDLANRIINNRSYYGTFSDFISLIKTKNQTFSAVSRHLIHMILDMDYGKPFTYDYVRLLGFSQNAEGLFKKYKECDKITLLTNSSDIRSYIDKARISGDHKADMLNLELRIDEIYNILRLSSALSPGKKADIPDLFPEIRRKIIVL